MDAIHFVPQSRPRLFIVAIQKSLKLPAGLFSKKPSPIWHPRGLVSAYRRLPKALKADFIFWNVPAPQERTSLLSDLIEEKPTGVKWHPAEETERLVSMMSPLNLSKLREVQSSGQRRVGTVYKRTRPVKVDGKVVGKAQRAEVRFDEVSGCLRTPTGGSSRQTILLVEGRNVRSRLLSPREAARIMGVPDDYPLPRNYNDAYHVFGDGLVVPVVSWLERHLIRRLCTETTPFLARVA